MSEGQVAQMIRIPQPSMSLNAKGVPKPYYKMYNTMEVAETYTPDALLDWVATVARGVKKLEALVIRSHGDVGFVGLGTGIGMKQSGAFAKIRGLVSDVFIVGCKVAGERKKRGTGEIKEGMSFCLAVAAACGAFVYASSAAQAVEDSEERDFGLPFGCIDDYELPAFVFYPDGLTVQKWEGRLPYAKIVGPRLKKMCQQAVQNL